MKNYRNLIQQTTYLLKKSKNTKCLSDNNSLKTDILNFRNNLDLSSDDDHNKHTKLNNYLKMISDFYLKKTKKSIENDFHYIRLKNLFQGWAVYMPFIYMNEGLTR